MLNRRTFLKAVGASGSLALAHVEAWDLRSDSGLGENIRIWDQHAHLGQVPGDTPEERMAFLVKCMDRLGVERLILSQGYSDDRHPNPPEQFRLENDRVMRAVKAFPGRAYGSVYLTPALLDFSMQELNRCVRDGPMVMIGEIEAEARCNVPAMDPIAEWAVENEVVILQHEWIKADGNEPGESSPFDVVELAQRHPQLQIVCAHTGGNWELGIRAIRATKNVYCGLAGSDPTSGYVEMAVRELGAERVVFGSDVGGRSFASQVAKVEGAYISESDKKLILGGNLRRLLAPMLQKKGYKV
ncbi:MAG TPA: amidohydrolase family protein [Terriglobia bacterium]|nr:amidohydrolase family protein [Terriglobia bacterium]